MQDSSADFSSQTKGPGQKALYVLSAAGAKRIDVPFRGPRRAHDEVVRHMDYATKFIFKPTKASYLRVAKR